MSENVFERLLKRDLVALLFSCKRPHRTNLPVLSKSPVVCRLERAVVTHIGGQATILVLVVDCLLTVLEHPATEFAGIGALLPMNMLLVFV